MDSLKMHSLKMHSLNALLLPATSNKASAGQTDSDKRNDHRPARGQAAQPKKIFATSHCFSDSFFHGAEDIAARLRKAPRLATKNDLSTNLGQPRAKSQALPDSRRHWIGLQPKQKPQSLPVRHHIVQRPSHGITHSTYPITQTAWTTQNSTARQGHLSV